MAIDIRLPNITGSSEREQLSQVKGYLYQLAGQLQFALNTMEASPQAVANAPASAVGASGGSSSEVDAQATFNAVKGLIIKSADIVEAYYEEIDSLLSMSGNYVASSDFGVYREETNNSISANSESITQHLSRIETIESDMDAINSATKEQRAYIQMGAVGTTLDDTGLATETAPGIEIGDYQVLDDGETFLVNKKYARFTAYGLELFGDSIDEPVAYIKQYKLYITNAEVTGSLKLGAFEIDTSKGLTLKWVGRG